MSGRLYRTPTHADDKDDIVQVWVVPVEPDYEAAAERLPDSIEFNRVLIAEDVVDAALKGNTDENK